MFRHLWRTLTNERGQWEIPAAMLASSLIGSFGSKKGGMEQGYDVVQMPQWSWNEGFQRNLSDYLSGGLQAMQQGQPAPWWQKAEPIMREGMMRGLNESMYGRPGERTGAMQQAADLGAITGVGPKATWAQGRKLLGDYMDKSSQIDEYLTSLGVNIRRGSEQLYLQGAQGMTQGPPSTVVNKMGGVYGPQGPSPWQTLSQTIGQNAGDIWGGIQNWFNTKDFGSYGASAAPAYYNTPGTAGFSPMPVPSGAIPSNMGFGNTVYTQYP